MGGCLKCNDRDRRPSKPAGATISAGLTPPTPTPLPSATRRPEPGPDEPPRPEPGAVDDADDCANAPKPAPAAWLGDATVPGLTSGKEMSGVEPRRSPN